ncbi:MAG: M81 family peptidase [Alphaproteobacteria bacterium]|nr:M81 family peptidase [Alphaproteobacteria bacterium]
MPKRFLAAVMRHETNTFSPLATPLAAFGRGQGGRGPLAGEAAIAAYRGTNNPLAAFIAIAQSEGADLVVPIAANAAPSGRVADRAFAAIADTILAAVAGGCDALFLDLHGAMVTETLDDAEGELLTRIRRLAPDLPIAVALDFHTNFSAAMAQATTIAGYRTYPHVDMAETGTRAGRALLGVLAGAAAPAILWRSLPMLTHMQRQTPGRPPMRPVMARAIAAEAAGEVLLASVLGGFPLADIPYVGVTPVIVADEAKRAAAEALLEDLSVRLWESRAEFLETIEPMEQSIARAKLLGEGGLDEGGGPVVLADHGDNTGAGGPADGMAVLAEVLRQGLEGVAAGPFWDPAAVARLAAAGVGAEVELDVGGRTDMPSLGLKGCPLRLRGRVRALTDGRFTVTGPMMTGMRLSLGRTAVLDVGAALVVIAEERAEPFDAGVFTHCGIEPARQQFLLVKSRQHFRAGFETIAKHIVLVAGPGVCASDFASFPWRRLRRPIYPLDPLTVLPSA